MSITIKHWRQVPESKKEYLWTQLSKVICYPADKLGIGRKNALMAMGKCFRNWKSDLNTDYVQKQKTPFSQYGKITVSEWNEFVAQKTSLDALALH